MAAVPEQDMIDVLIIGGGINGCGIARDAAGRGYSVCLCEANDLGSGTSSASTKLVHGGLRYLEFYEFALVRKSLMEREVLWRMAPHIIRPMRFVLPHHKGLRPHWLLRLGLFIYDHIGGRKLLPPTRAVDLARDETGAPLKTQYKRAFEYSDCWVDDSRLVVLNAQDAAARGAQIRTRTRVTGAMRMNGHWSVSIRDQISGEVEDVQARLLINAAGPWVDEVLQSALGRNDAQNVRLVRGSHIVVNKLFDHPKCYIFQNADDRIVFAIPYENDFTLIGTTDQDHDSSLDKVEASKEEIEYLCETVNGYFKQPVSPKDVVWTYSGVRPLYDDGVSAAHEATRDYVISQDGDAGSSMLINIFGGKITTFRRLADAVLDIVQVQLGTKGDAWTADSKLPGGDFAVAGFDELRRKYMEAYPFMESRHLERLLRSYGTRTAEILGNAQSLSDLGELFCADLYEAEVKYLHANEWARQPEDILYRRTKLGIAASKKCYQSLGDFLTRLA